MSPTASFALTAANENKIVTAFRSARALSGASARRLRDLRLGQSRALRNLVSALIVRRAGADRYFLDEEVWALRRRLKGRTVARIAVAFALLAAASLIYLVGR